MPFPGAVGREGESVFWWFEREEEFLRFEVLDLGDRWELRVLYPDGTEQLEHFTNATALATRQHELHRQCASQGWVGPHGPFF
jgi:hypothetical protein